MIIHIEKYRQVWKNLLPHSVKLNKYISKEILRSIYTTPTITEKDKGD